MQESSSRNSTKPDSYALPNDRVTDAILAFNSQYGGYVLGVNQECYYAMKAALDKGIEPSIKLLKWDPQTAADFGWNSRVLRASADSNPYLLFDLKSRDLWFEGWNEADVAIAQQVR